MINFLIGPFLEWLPRVFSWVVFLFAAFFYFRYRGEKEAKRKKLFRMLALVSVVFMIFYAGLLTWGQHYVWSEGDLSRSFLTTSLPKNIPVPLVEALPEIFQAPSRYFIFYSLQHFWFPVILNILIAFVFFWFLGVLKKYNGRFFEEGETNLGFLLSLLVGWPLFLVFLPLAFLFVVLVSIVKTVFFKEYYTTLGVPFLLGAFAALALAPWLLTVPLFASLTL